MAARELLDAREFKDGPVVDATRRLLDKAIEKLSATKPEKASAGPLPVAEADDGGAP